MTDNPFTVLTKRERQIPMRLPAIRTNAQLADEFGISRHTVKHHLTRIYRKLGVFDRTGAVAAAVTGIVPPWEAEVVET